MHHTTIAASAEGWRPRTRTTALPLAGLFSLLARWLRRIQHRRALRELDDRMLRDIGLTRGEVDRISREPFWRD